MERKLTAILSADVKGYSRLMDEDEEATLHTLTAYRAVMDPLISQYRGRIVGTAGDSVLAEFASVIDAVRCAVEIQLQLKAQNADLPVHRRMEFRIGINLGDVMVDGEQIYGEGVNIAARLQSLADAGGIFIAGTVYDQIENKLTLAYEYLGEQTVKNITKPVRVWRVRELGAAAPESKTVLRQAQHERESTPRTLSLSKGALALLGLLIVGRLVTLLYPSLRTFRIPHSALRTQEALPLPDKPSIAVLPFTNMSGDSEQGYFSDGMTEDLITALSKLSGLFVIARTSVFTYKGKTVKVTEVSKELGVRYVLEGSVRKADSRVRITAQLVDATTGQHLWAEQYDRELKDIFALQDEIREKIVFALKVNLTLEEQERFRRAPTSNLEAYDYFLRGRAYYWTYTKEANAQARQMFERAIALDSQYAAAYAALSLTQLTDWVIWDPFRSSLDQLFALAQRAVELDDSLPLAHSVVGYVYLWKKPYERAIAEAERALTLDPNFAEGYFRLAEILNFAGRPEEAIGLVEKAMRLDPTYPTRYVVTLGHAYHLTGRYEEAIGAFKRALARSPDLFATYLLLALSYGESGREEEARAALAELLRMQPYIALDGVKLRLPYKDPAILTRQLDLLHKAGLKWRWPTDSPEALGALWSGLEYFVRRTKEGNAQARQQFERAIARDPRYAAAHAFLGLTYLTEWARQWTQDPQALEQAFALTQKAVALDDSLPWVHSVLGSVYMWKKQHAQAIAEAERTLVLDPNDIDGHGALAEVLNFAGQPEKAVGLAEKALRLNPTYPIFYLFELGWAYQLLGRYKEAITTLKKVVIHAPDHLGAHTVLAVSYSELGQEEEARAEAAEILRINPDYSLEVDRQRAPFKDPAVAERVFAALGRAGLQ